MGIPYAYHGEDDKGEFCECPVCGEKCYLKTRKDNDSFLITEYQTHYATNHES